MMAFGMFQYYHYIVDNKERSVFLGGLGAHGHKDHSQSYITTHPAIKQSRPFRKLGGWLASLSTMQTLYGASEAGIRVVEFVSSLSGLAQLGDLFIAGFAHDRGRAKPNASHCF